MLKENLLKYANELDEYKKKEPVLGDFSMVQMNRIESGGKIVKKFLPRFA